ncbi:GIY-YIG nuclease family protein [Salmonella sp. s55004]
MYVISCKRCKLVYVGETKGVLADRITKHIRSIKT